VVTQLVFKNTKLQNKICDVLNEHVFRNSDIQYYVHQALINQALNPNQENIRKLIVNSLSSPQNIDAISKIIAENLEVIQQPIKESSLSFLNS
jgi:ethanolamine ammonia-lyase small subunit